MFSYLGPRKLYRSGRSYCWQRPRICICSRVDANLFRASWVAQSSQKGNTKSYSEHIWLHCKSNRV